MGLNGLKENECHCNHTIVKSVHVLISYYVKTTSGCVVDIST